MILAFEDLIPTRPSNTGSNRQDARGEGFGCLAEEYSQSKNSTMTANLDYLTVCGTLTCLSSLEANVFAAFGARFDWNAARPGVVGKYYELNARTANGLMLSLNLGSNGRATEFRLSISGKILGHIRKVKLHEFGKYLLSENARCTRFDWAIDDFDRTLDIDTIRSECDSGNRHGFAEYTYYESGKKNHKQLGKTIYLGAKDTEFIARIYDKTVESKGEIDSIRWEAQTRGDVADSFFRQYFGSSNIPEITRDISMRAIGKFRFVRQISSVLSRCPDLDWWSVFVKKVGGQVKISVRRLQTMLSDKKRWIESQVCGTLSLIFTCMGIKEGAEWLLGEIEKKYYQNYESNQLYRSCWKDRIAVETVEYSNAVCYFAADKSFKDLSREALFSASEGRSSKTLLEFLVRSSIIVGLFLKDSIGRQLVLFS